MTPKLISYLASSNPCLFIPTVEDSKALSHVVNSLIELDFINRELGVWKSTTGMLTFPRGKWVHGLANNAEGRPIIGFEDAINRVAKTPQCIGVFYHIRGLLDQPNIIQAIIDATYQAKKNFSTIIFIGSFLPLPPELLNIVTYVDFPLPTKEEIEELFEDLIQVWEENHNLSFPKNKKKRKAIISKAAMSAQGLDMLSAENALALAISITGEPNLKVIQSQKEQHVKKSEVLEFINTDLSLKDVGGFAVLKEWLLLRKEAFTDKAKAYGLSWPKGILIVGAPGLGKSFISACIASFLELPILRLNMSNVFDRYVGSSESNLKRALQVVEAVSPCITGDSKILLENGCEVKIKDLYDNGDVENLSVVCMDDNLCLTTTRVNNITCRKAPDLYELRLQHGKLKATGEHQQPVMRNGELHWIKTKDILMSDYVAVTRKTDPIPAGRLIEKARKSIGAEQRWFNPEIGSLNINDYEKSILHPDRKELEILVNRLDAFAKKSKGNSTKEIEQLRSLLHTDVSWSKVKKIQELPSNGVYVYDLVCKDHHNFIANGIVTHNCLLILEEADKAMSGMESSGKSDSGVTARVLSTLLTWRQETKYPVFMVCTANNPDLMPSMIYRKGRLDEVWAVDLPNSSEREEILKVHLERRNRDPSLFDTHLLASVCKNFTGAEIEAAIEDAMFNAFYEGIEITTGHILRSLENTNPQSDLSSDAYIKLKEWMAVNARSVSKRDDKISSKN